MGQGVDWEVGPDRRGGAGCFPVERHNVRGQVGTQRPVGVEGQSPGEGGVGPAEAGRCRVNGRGGTDKSESRHLPLMREENVERREARLSGQDWKGGRPEAVGNPSLDLTPMNIHLGEKPFGGDEEVGAIGQDWKQKRVSKAVAEVRGDTPTS